MNLFTHCFSFDLYFHQMLLFFFYQENLRRKLYDAADSNEVEKVKKLLSKATPNDVNWKNDRDGVHVSMVWKS